MREVKVVHVWLVGLVFFVVFRLVLGDLFSEAGLIGAVLFGLGMYWFMVPFLLGKDMALPRFSNTVFKKGEDDSVRYMLFATGIFLCYCALTA